MADLLLDTHAALWWWRDLPKLSRAAIAAIEDGPSIAVSAISGLEIAIKWRTGRLTMIDDPVMNYPRLMRENGFIDVAIEPSHALSAGTLPGNHRDPFDRVIAAQALALGLIVVTCDPAIAAFGCKVLW